MKNVTFLQGPIGPFFSVLANELEKFLVKTHTICFNGGDHFFAKSKHVIQYLDKAENWSEFFSEHLRKNNIDTVFCYGDCRFYHHQARAICKEHNINFWVFEEGYLRPDFITLEQGGVNANSALYPIKEKALLRKSTDVDLKPTKEIGYTFFTRFINATLYYLSLSLLSNKFKNNVHHRKKAVFEGKAWLKGYWYKAKYFIYDRFLFKKWRKKHSKNIFFVPLQTHNDAQIVCHSSYDNIESFISDVITSFGQYTDDKAVLLFKHHPMDRGYKNYHNLIRTLSRKLDVEDRVKYGFEYHLPSLYRHLKGCITINSTVGLSSLYHLVPTKVMGRALYDISGATTKGDLDSFWKQGSVPERDTVNRIRENLFKYSQINGSFYKYERWTAHQIIDLILTRNELDANTSISTDRGVLSD